MEKKILPDSWLVTFFIVMVLLGNMLALFSCPDTNQLKEPDTPSLNPQTIDQKTRIIKELNEQAWQRVEGLVFSDSDFLQTKEPMSDEAIALVDPETGLSGNKPYNRIVYATAFDRVLSQAAYIKNDRIKLRVNSGQELNMAEDLFLYIINVIEEWNYGLEIGTLKILHFKKGKITFIVRRKQTSKDQS